MIWTIVITGINCDDTEILTVRNQLRDSLAGHHDIRTLTMQQWLWQDHWHGTVDPAPPEPSGDIRLIRHLLP